MVDFYQKVATPQTQFRQQASPSGPSVDVNARARAQNDANNSLGNAIQSLIGTASNVNTIVERGNELEKRRMFEEHRLDIQGDLDGVATFINNQIRARAKKEGKDPSDYSNDELKNIVRESSDTYVKTNNLAEKNYFTALQDSLKDKELAVFDKNIQENKVVRQNKKKQRFSKNASNIFKVGDKPVDVVNVLQDQIDTSVGFEEKVTADGVSYMPEIQDTVENAKLLQLQSVVESVMHDKDIKAVALLDSKELREYFGEIPDLDNVVNSMKYQVQGQLNKNRQVSYTRLEDSMYTALDAGMFTSPDQIDKEIDDQLGLMKPIDRPETKDIMRLKQQLNASMQDEMNFQMYTDRLQGGDYTVLERSGLEKKEIEAVKNRFFSVQTGINDLSPQGISTAIKSGDFDAQLKSYFSAGYPISPDLEKWANTAPSGGIQGLRDKHETFLQLNALTQDTNTSTLDVFNPKEYGRMMFLGNLMDNIDSGTMDDKEAMQVYSAFNNDLQKNVDSFGTFVSSKAAEALNDTKVQEWLTQMKTDAPWTYDEFSSQAYMERQFKNYFSYAMETTDDVDGAKELAEKMFYSRHVPFENPDGSEGVLPYEFNKFRVKDFIELANELPEFKDIKESAGFLGLMKDYDFNSNLSFKPDPSYEKNKLMNFYYDNKFILSIDSDMMQNNLNVIGKKRVREAETRNVETTQNK